MYDIILFDLDDTLLDFAASETESLKKIHAEFYAHLDISVFRENFLLINNALWKNVGTSINPLTPADIRVRRFREFNQKFQLHVDPEAAANRYTRHLGETAEWLPGVKEAIHVLHKKAYILGIITNGLISVQYKKHERHELSTWFKSFIVSDNVNITKPHKGIFELAFAELEALDLRKVLMVGDSLHADGLGAKNAGIDFCLVGQEPYIDHEIPIKYTISSVCELPQKLGH